MKMKIFVLSIAVSISIAPIINSMTTSKELKLAIKGKHPTKKSIYQLIQHNKNHTSVLYEVYLTEIGTSPLVTAVEKHKWNVVSFFLKEGVSPNYISTEGRLPLNVVCHHLQTHIVHEMLTKKADPNGVDLVGRTPLHTLVGVAATDTERVKQLAIMKKLMSAGADPNKQDSEGDTPLHALVRKYHHYKNHPKSTEIFSYQKFDTKMMHLLLFHGAKFDIYNNKGETAASLEAASLNQFFQKDHLRLIKFMSNLLQKCGFNKDIANLIAQQRYE